MVGSWNEKHLGGWRLAVDSSGKVFGLELSRGPVRVNLASAGQGMQEVLPVVTQQFALQLGTGQGDSMFCLIEQPEIHLHDAVHAALADLFIDTVRQRPVSMIVETHSENLLLRVRRRIAEGVLSPDQVALYWVEDDPEGCSSVRPIRINAAGEVDDWPKGVFSEAYDEVRALVRAAHKNNGNFRR